MWLVRGTYFALSGWFLVGNRGKIREAISC